jgi:hypothetical protein
MIRRRLDLMRLSFWSTCEFDFGDREGADRSFLFTLEEFGREVLFLLDTIEEVHMVQSFSIVNVADCIRL